MMSTQQAGEPVRVAYGRPPRARTRGRDEVAISPSAVRSAQAMIHAGRDLAGALNPLAVDEGLAAPLSGHELDEVSEAIAVVRDKLNRTEKFIAELRTRPSFLSPNARSAGHNAGRRPPVSDPGVHGTTRARPARP